MIVTKTFLGTPKFPIAAKAALADSQLRANMRNATHTIREKRAKVIGELDDFQELRQGAADIKDHTMAGLGDYLLQAERSLTASGATVHWARDAAEANKIVVDIAKKHKVDEVVKVKSMATQEIELNVALEAAGIAAWETDLAEMIVQLGDDLPSHILVPAIHRNRRCGHDR
jgi:L-lactate dehydrogenase complex protein LldF